MNKLIRNTAMTVALFAIVGAIAISDAQRAAPDLILSNGKIITVDQRFTIAEAVAIKTTASSVWAAIKRSCGFNGWSRPVPESVLLWPAVSVREWRSTCPNQSRRSSE